MRPCQTRGFVMPRTAFTKLTNANWMSSDRQISAPPSWRALMRRWAAWLGRRRRRMEIDELGVEGAASIAREIGTNAPELRALAGKWPDSSDDLLARRLKALNLNSTTLSATKPAVARD